jgi:CrcB protein
VSAGLWTGVALLGGTGACLRYGVTLLVERRVRTRFPVWTLAVNLGGSFALGLLRGLDVSGDALFLAGTGLLGSFTTFSTWIVETEQLPRRLAALNLALSLGAGLAAAGAGWAIGAAF